MNYLNLGCGSRFCREWTNIDFTASDSDIIPHNLTKGIPFSDNFFDIVYHSHVLEHFAKSQASSFLRECYRVLRPKGIIRIVVPDLEKLIHDYIFALEQISCGSLGAKNNYEWLILELFDQMVRNHSGGYMADYLFQENIPNQRFILERLGTEAKKLIEIGNYNRDLSNNSSFCFRKILRSINKFISCSKYRETIFLKILLVPEDYRALQIGRFRQSGENHQWMYDRYSLKRLLSQCGFVNIVQRTASDSYIANWCSFNLDTESDGTAYKPNSLYMEAIKPSL